ncbi:MAG: helix-turn-helix domain-containing protein [Bacteroidales bacterium]|nr:helix-turn-helix domain-containing protein [Bacteroidales bacterium]
MNTLSELENLEKIHHIIKIRKRGTPGELANRLNISRSCLYRYISKLEEFGAEVVYSRTGGFFYYKNNFEFRLVVEINAMLKTFGGKNFFRPFILDGGILHL